MSALINIWWLGTKELKELVRDVTMMLFIVWSFGFSIYTQSTGTGETVRNAAIAIVDEDQSQLSRAITELFYPPYFQKVQRIGAAEVDRAMDQGHYTFVVEIPPRFEADTRAGRDTDVHVSADATAVQQAGTGSGYIQNMIAQEVTRYRQEMGEGTTSRGGLDGTLANRRAFNPNGTQAWFSAVVALADQLSMLMIILTGAALLREREHGTIEHLLVMPLTAVQIALAKVWANGLVIVVAFTLSLLFVVQGALQVPIAGSRTLLLVGTAIYVFAAASIGILLGTIARTMAQFALLMMMSVMPMMMLSGGMSPVESQPQWVQYITWFFPSRHYIGFMQAIVYRGADAAMVWQEVVTMLGMGVGFLTGSLLMFRRSIAG
ncbi:MAG: ABC transporter permease [Proteobacteria bacterium]|nr:ABC transporter permease [Pseudomonadota bacterium]